MMDDSKQNNISTSAAKDSASLNIAGISYIVGDLALWAAGEGCGAWWLAGGLAAAAFGHPKADKQYQLLCDRLGNHLRRQGVEIPENPTTECLRRKGGVFDAVESFMYAYPSQILNTAYTIGSLLLIRSGLRPGAGKKKDFALAGAGALVIAGALGGLLIKEKKPDPEHPPQGIIGKTKAWFEENPLRWSSAAYYANDVMLGISTYQNKKNNPRNSLKWLTVATYALGNYMLGVSKSNNADTHANISAMKQVADTAAQVVAAQPKEVQEALIHQMAGYLSTQPETKLKTNEIADLMHAKLAEIGKPSLQNWQHVIQKPTDFQPSPNL